MKRKLTTDDFRITLRDIFARAKGHTVLVSAGELHREVGGYPSTSHRMPLCRAVMRNAMQEGDCITKAPPKGIGATLTISYRLPRCGD